MNINNHLPFQSFNRADRIAENVAERMDKRFTEADTDQSGSVSFAEVEAAAGEGANLERLEKMFSHADINSDGEVTRAEQLQLYDKRMDRLNSMMEQGLPFGMRGDGTGGENGAFNRVDHIAESLFQKMDKRFEAADADQSGSVTFAEIQATAPEGANQERLETLFNRADTNGDGELSKEEQQQHYEKRLERLANPESGAHPFEKRTGDKAANILQSLTGNQMLTEEQQIQVQDALSDLNLGRSRESVFDAVKTIREILPSVREEV